MNKKTIRKIVGRNEFYISLVFIALCLLIQVRSGQFFTPNNIVDLLSAMVVPGIFAIGEFIGDHEDFFESPAGMAVTTVCAIAAMALVGTIDYETGARY